MYSVAINKEHKKLHLVGYIYDFHAFPCCTPCTCNRCTSMRIIQKLKIQIGWKEKGNHCCEVVDHPTHGPDLAPRDFHVFLHLKKLLAGQKFHEDIGEK